MIMNLVTGIIGLGMMIAFMAFMVVWVPAPPLIIIVVGVVLLMLYDFVRSLRGGENGAG